MAGYQIFFTPSGSYFFGNEKNFRFTGQKNNSAYCNSYFIHSEDMPSQSTVLGALRFALLPNVKTDFKYDDSQLKQNTDAVGEESFDILKGNVQDFGKIKKLSPIFISKQKNTFFYENDNPKKDIDALSGILIPAPLDHQLKHEEEKDGKIINEDNIKYTPFSDFSDEISTSDGKKITAKDFDVKIGLADGFIFIDDSEISDANGTYLKTSDVIGSETRIGINRSNKDNGFFKKEYKYLKPGCSFSIYAEIDDNSLDGTKKTVCMGQGKTPFAVTFVKKDNICFQKRIEAVLNRESKYSLVYCFSDTFVNDSPYKKTIFASADTKNYRSFTTSWNGTKGKGSVLVRLIKAGSIFITDNPVGWKESIGNNENAEQIGYNSFIIIGG